MPTPLSLPSLLISLTAAFLTTAATYPNCNPTYSCGPIVNITYPFSGGDRPAHCGLPEFRLTCRNKTTTELTSGSTTYRVLQLDQTQRALILSRTDLYNNTCPSQFHNSTLNSTLFSSEGPENEEITLFYSCTKPPVPVWTHNLFSCDSHGLNYSDAYYLIGHLPSDPVFRIIYCSINIRARILKSMGDQLSNSQLSLGEALMYGFSVNYSFPYQRSCSECLRLGGQCGFDSVLGQPVCVCGNRPCPFPVSFTPDDTGPLEGIGIQ